MYENLVERLNKHSAEHEHHGGITAEAADAIEELSRRAEEWEVIAESWQKACKGLESRMPRWVPVTERLPEYGERVLVFGGVTIYVAYYDKNRYGCESWHKLNSKSHYCNPTHWMPLPSTEGLNEA